MIKTPISRLFRGGALKYFALVTALAFLTSSTLLRPRLEKPIHLLANQSKDDLKLHFKAALQRAEQSITLAMYTLTDPMLIAALSSKDCPVQVICDPASARAPLHYPAQVTVREAVGLMHQKILCVDHEELWIGSCNWTPQSLRVHDNAVLVMQCRELTCHVEERLKDRDREISPFFSVEIQDQPVTCVFSPDRGNQALNYLISLIDRASKSIRVAMFTWTHPKLTDAIVRAHRRGIVVNVVIDRGSSRGASKGTIQTLMDAGTSPRVQRGRGLMHHKLAWIDGRLVIGSTNWTRAAFAKNEEVFVVLHQMKKKNANALKKLWNKIWETAYTPPT